MSCQVLNKMKKFNELVKTNYNPNWVYIPDHRYEILFIYFINKHLTKC